MPKQEKPLLLPKDVDCFSVSSLLTCHSSPGLCNLLLGNPDLLKVRSTGPGGYHVLLSRELKLFKYFSLSRLVKERLGLGTNGKNGKLLLKQKGNPQAKGKSIYIKLA